MTSSRSVLEVILIVTQCRPGCGCIHKSICTPLFEPPLGNSRGRAETNQDIIPRTNPHPNKNGAWGASEQLLRAPKVPKLRHLGQPIYLNSTSKFEVELALKKWPRLGSILSDDSVTVITSVLINENIDPIRGQFVYLNFYEKSS